MADDALLRELKQRHLHAFQRACGDRDGTGIEFRFLERIASGDYDSNEGGTVTVESFAAAAGIDDVSAFAGQPAAATVGRRSRRTSTASRARAASANTTWLTGVTTGPSPITGRMVNACHA